MNKLTKEQQRICNHNGNVLVNACPGSGKTMTLITKIEKLISGTKKTIVAITYTARAATEIENRLNAKGIDKSRLWVGTIHQFCLKFVLRQPNKFNKIPSDFKIMNEFQESSLIRKLKKKHKVLSFKDIDTSYNRELKFNYPVNSNDYKMLQEFAMTMKNQNQLNFNSIIAQSYKLLKDDNLASIVAKQIDTILVDEYQDTQDLQYAIISAIYNNSKNSLKVNFFGDPNQSIYRSLGAIDKDIKSLNKEFIGGDFKEMKLTLCFRSSQRVIDYYTNYSHNKTKIAAATPNKKGSRVNYQTIKTAKIPTRIERIINECKDDGVEENEICIMASQNILLEPIGRYLEKVDNINIEEGVKISTCHGVKGEEYKVVIIFGIQEGLIPHYNTVRLKDKKRYNLESKNLLYVAFSRAKERIYVLMENDRETSGGNVRTVTKTFIRPPKAFEII